MFTFPKLAEIGHPTVLEQINKFLENVNVFQIIALNDSRILIFYTGEEQDD